MGAGGRCLGLMLAEKHFEMQGPIGRLQPRERLKSTFEFVLVEARRRGFALGGAVDKGCVSLQHISSSTVERSPATDLDPSKPQSRA